MKINYKTNLRLGSLELERAQTIAEENSLVNIHKLISEYGLILIEDNAGIMPIDWKVLQTGVMAIQIKAGSGIFADDNGTPRFVDIEDTAINLTEADGTYNIYAEYLQTNYETGTVDLTNGSDQAVGTNTEFDKLFANGRNIVVDNIPYLVLSVESPTAMTLASNYTGTTVTDKQFKVGGWFTEYPIGITDNLIYEYHSVQFIIASSVAVPDSNQYQLCQLVISGGDITILKDERQKNILKLLQQKLVRNINGVYAETIISHTEASTVIKVNEGQTINFPNSYDADFNTVFIRTTTGLNKGFKYTSKTASTFEGVTYFAGTFTSDSGSKVWHVSSAALTETGIMLGDSLIRYNNRIDGYSDLPTAEAIEVNNNLIVKRELIGLTRHFDNATSVLQDGIFLVIDSLGNEIKIICNAKVDGVNSDKTFRFNFDDASVTTGDVIFSLDGVDRFIIHRDGNIEVVGELDVTADINLTGTDKTITGIQKLQIGTPEALPITDTYLAVEDIVIAKQFRLYGDNAAPISSTDTGTIGEIRIDVDGVGAGYLYYCYATNKWTRIAFDNTAW